MSAVVKIIPKDKRLRVTAIYEHKTVEYGGNIYEFIEQLIRERCSGRGSFDLNQGDACKLTFDFREKAPTETG